MDTIACPHCLRVAPLILVKNGICPNCGQIQFAEPPAQPPLAPPMLSQLEPPPPEPILPAQLPTSIPYRKVPHRRKLRNRPARKPPFVIPIATQRMISIIIGGAIGIGLALWIVSLIGKAT